MGTASGGFYLRDNNNHVVEKFSTYDKLIYVINFTFSVCEDLVIKLDLDGFVVNGTISDGIMGYKNLDALIDNSNENYMVKLSGILDVQPGSILRCHFHSQVLDVNVEFDMRYSSTYFGLKHYADLENINFCEIENRIQKVGISEALAPYINSDEIASVVKNTGGFEDSI